MKWFHHECAARHDPKLQMLGSTHGAEGIGIYWGLLEEIGQHSDTFHLKIMGISREADELFSDFLRYPQTLTENPFGPGINAHAIPRLPVKLLTKNLFTSIKNLQVIIAFCVEVGLFDARKWLEFNVLYSPSFEHRADDYTRRINRSSDKVRRTSEHSSDNVRTLSEQSTNTLRTMSEVTSDFVRPDTETEQNTNRTEEEKNRNRTEAKMSLKNTQNVDNSTSCEPEDLPQGVTQKSDDSYLIEPNELVFEEYKLKFHSILKKWNRQNPDHILDWHPSTRELKKIFCAGEYDRKLAMCFHAYKLLGEQINYPELVLRALHLLLAMHKNSKIDNPFGWIWTSLHGNGSGTRPWAQFLTAEEENARSPRLRNDSG